MSLPYMPFYVSDFEGDTSHLTLEEDGAYNRLLRLCWRSPGCSIPDDDAWIRRRMRVDEKTYAEVVRPIIEEFFISDQARLFSPRQIAEYESILETHKKRVSAGQKGGRKNKSLKNNDTDPKPGLSRAKAGPKQPEPDPEPEEVTKDSDESLEPDGSSDPPEKFDANLIFFGKQRGSALRYLTDTGVPDKQARSMLGQWRKQHGDQEVVAAIGQASSVTASAPIPYITKILQNGHQDHAKPSRSHGYNQQTESKLAFAAAILGHAPGEPPGHREGLDLETGMGSARVIEH